MVQKQQTNMATTRIKLDPGVLIMDPDFESYYRDHVVLNSERIQQQKALPLEEQDPAWFMLVELDEEASMWWLLSHPS